MSGLPLPSPPERFERYRELVGDWRAFADALVRPLPACLWANTLRIGVDELAAWLPREGLEAEPLGWCPGAFKLAPETRAGRTVGFHAGLFHVQEEVSLLPVVLLAPRPGERVLDLCAAPGGKACQIAVAMEDRGTLVANDRDPLRVGVMLRHLERLGVSCCVATVHDGGNLSHRRVGTFDRVLADVPCSCEGTVRKNPELRRRRAGRTEKLQAVQRALLRKAIGLCRPGGRVVYSTCTFAPEENEAIVADVLAELGTARLLPARVEGWRSSPGLRAWGARSYGDELERTMRVYPHQNDCGGFFVALLERLEG